jgi:hypothetical protein
VQILSEWADGLSEHATSKIMATAMTRQVLSPEQLEQGRVTTLLRYLVNNSSI